jgi:hypothetical protein
MKISVKTIAVAPSSAPSAGHHRPRDDARKSFR